MVGNYDACTQNKKKRKGNLSTSVAHFQNDNRKHIVDL